MFQWSTKCISFIYTCIHIHSFNRYFSVCVCVSWLVMSHSVTPWSPPVFSLSLGILQARILSELPFPAPADLPNPGIKPRSPVLQAGSLPSEPPGKPKNTEVGSRSLLQQIFANPGIEPGSLALQADSLSSEWLGKPKSWALFMVNSGLSARC